MFSLKDALPRRRMFFCAFTTRKDIKGERLHLKMVRADNENEAVGIVTSWCWANEAAIDMFRMIEWHERPEASPEDHALYGDAGIVEPVDV